MRQVRDVHVLERPLAVKHVAEEDEHVRVPLWTKRRSTLHLKKKKKNQASRREDEPPLNPPSYPPSYRPSYPPSCPPSYRPCRPPESLSLRVLLGREEACSGRPSSLRLSSSQSIAVTLIPAHARG